MPRTGTGADSGQYRIPYATSRRLAEAEKLAQPDLSGNSFGNKGWFVTLGFRKYLRKFAYASQKVAIALDRNKLSVGAHADAELQQAPRGLRTTEDLPLRGLYAPLCSRHPPAVYMP